VPPYDGGNGTFGSAVITLNTSSMAPYNFNNESPIDRAVTLLHELGHVYEYLFGPSTTLVSDDQYSAATSVSNTQLIKDTCFK